MISAPAVQDRRVPRLLPPAPSSLPRVSHILLAESQVLFRQGIRKLLESEPDFRVVGEVASGRELVRYALELLPDVVVTELAFDDLDGLRAIRAVHEENSAIKIVVLTDCHDLSCALKAAEAGARAFVPKTATAAELTEVLRRVMRGERLFGATTPLESKLDQKGAKPGLGGKPKLTSSETRLLQELARGSSNQEIALVVGLSEKTVRNKLSNIYDKLQLHNRTEAALYAVKEGVACG